MLNRRLPGVYRRGTSTWLYVRGCVCIRVMRSLPPWNCSPRGTRQEPQSTDAGKKQIRTGSDRGERGNAGDLLLDWPRWNGQIERAILGADDRIALVVESLEVGIVGPHAHREFELTNQACASHERGNAAIHAVVRRALRQQRTVRAAAANDLVTREVVGGVARVHATDVRAHRTRVAARIHRRVVEVVGTLPVLP